MKIVRSIKICDKNKKSKEKETAKVLTFGKSQGHYNYQNFYFAGNDKTVSKHYSL